MRPKNENLKTNGAAATHLFDLKGKKNEEELSV